MLNGIGSLQLLSGNFLTSYKLELGYAHII